MLNERNTLLEDDGIEEEILVEEECSVTQAVWGDIQGNIENQTDLQNALDAKQDSLTEAQLNAVNSGITSEKVTTYDGYADQIASKADQSALNAESTARGEADTALGTRIDNEALARQQADNGLQSQIDAITSKSDVVDVVANYAALQAYDTSALGNNDVIKVLDDETHEDALTYYRWSTATQTWSYIGQEAPYYSKGQMDVKLAEKQDKLTAGANIQIQNGTISATDTKYTNGNGLNLNGTEFSANTDVLATKEDLESYYTKPQTDNLLAPKLEAEVVAELPTTGEEGKLYLTPKAHTTQTATGNPIEATITAQAGQLESFQLDGDTFQQTYTGKNLLNPLTFVKGRLDNGVVGYQDETSSLEATATDITFTAIANFRGITSDYIQVVGGSQYVQNQQLTFDNNTGAAIAQYDSSKTFIQQDNVSTGTVLTMQATTAYIRIYYFARTAGTITLHEPQLEAGSQATSFEPYTGGQPSPSPEYPQQIQTVTGEQTVEIVGKNLFRAKDGQYRDNTLTVDVENGVIHVYGHQHATFDQNVWIPVEDIHADGTYTLTMNYSGSGGGSFRLTKDKSYQAANNFGGTYYSPNRVTPVTASATNITYNWALIYLGHGSSLSEVDYYINPQFESGSLSTYFSPYSKQTLPLNLGSIELCKLGTYQDYIYKDGDSWKVHNTIRKTIVNGGETWEAALSSLWGSNAYACSSIEGFKPWSPTKSDRFIDAELPQAANIQSGYMQMAGFSWIIRIVGVASVAELKTWLSSNNVTLRYVLATATDTVITDTTLIAQLEAIRTASLGNGTNTITNTATGTNLAGDMEFDYYEYDPTNRYDKWLWLDINNEYEQIGS